MAGLNWLNWVKLINSVGSSRATNKNWHMPHTQPQHWHYAIKIGRQNRGGHFRIKIPKKLGSRHGLCVVQIISKWTDCLGTRLIWWGDDWDDCTKYLGISQWGRNFSAFSPLAFQSGTLPEFFWNDLVPSCFRLYAWAIVIEQKVRRNFLKSGAITIFFCRCVKHLLHTQACLRSQGRPLTKPR